MLIIDDEILYNTLSDSALKNGGIEFHKNPDFGETLDEHHLHTSRDYYFLDDPTLYQSFRLDSFENIILDKLSGNYLYDDKINQCYLILI